MVFCNATYYVQSSIFSLVEIKHFLDGNGRCEACGDLFPCSAVDRLLANYIVLGFTGC